ncbi:hypothetical protein BOX15_Mlig024645g2 [Macrostomum lignano]|uniref:Transmembrane protein 216 n=1 Tax=Macrostomum lignano TaxID=282301 RepID=A0A267FF71_9PLAT|nr:hypothetical protein BOX15_Mlig012355g2 [Macrostomum lignano]PAA72406.1 hypothetical protein BOX15_Mlig024645g2 [Macrostomum lignano]
MTLKVVTRGKSRLVKSVQLAQRAIFLNAYYLAFFMVIEVGLFVWKGENLPFVTGILPQEVCLLFILAFMEIFRLRIANLGNILEAKGAAISVIVYSLFSGVGIAFFAVWQTYVLRLEFILCIVYLVFLLLELVLFIVGVVVYQPQ